MIDKFFADRAYSREIVKKGAAHIVLLFIIFVLPLVVAGTFYFIKGNNSSKNVVAASEFLETFDGKPTSPTPWSSSRFDLVVGGNDMDGQIDGQIINDDDSITFGPIEAGHGDDCGAPIGRTPETLNNHLIQVDNDPVSHQSTTRKASVFQCNDHMMTTIKAGYADANLTPRYLFDWTNRTSKFSFDTNTYGFGRNWWDVYIVPKEDALLDYQTVDEGGSQEQLPRRAVKFSFLGGSPRVHLIDNYKSIYSSGHWQSFAKEFPGDPSPTDPRIRRKFSFEVSKTSWKYEIQKQDGTFWTFSGNWPQPLSFDNGEVKLEHHGYNATKDGIKGTPWSQFTYHWDNFYMDNVYPDHTAFEPGPHFIDLRRDPNPNPSAPLKFNVNVDSSDIKNPVLIGQIGSQMTNDNVDPTNSSQWMQYRINNGSWQDMQLVKKFYDRGTGGGSFSTFKNSLTGVVSGENTVEFRYPNRPPQATWHFNGFTIKDVEMRIDPVGVVLPPTLSPTPVASTAPSLPSPSPIATIAPSPIPSPLPSPITNPSTPNTVTFEDKATGALSGAYPAGVMDWGSGKWYLSGPWGQFTTNSVSFTSSTVTSQTVNFTTPALVRTIEAFNGGSVSSTVSLACAGNTTKTVTIPVNTKTTITTGWTANCTTVTFSSSNGWNTNFDNLVWGSGTTAPVASPVPSPSPIPSPIPSPTTAPTTTTTVTFNDSPLNNKILNGIYPTGLIDWGTNNLWYVSSPWKLFTTKSISFNSASTIQAQFAFVGGSRSLVSLKAYNGGGTASTITLICTGNPNKVQVVNPGQVVTITTGWTNPCSFVRVNSTNGWNTNFDDLVIR